MKTKQQIEKRIKASIAFRGKHTDLMTELENEATIKALKWVIKND